MRSRIVALRVLAAASLLAMGLLGGFGFAQEIDATAKAKTTQKYLKTKVSVEFTDVRLEEILEELKEQVKGVNFLVDSKGGVSRNSKLSYKGKADSLGGALDGILKTNGLGVSNYFQQGQRLRWLDQGRSRPRSWQVGEISGLGAGGFRVLGSLLSPFGG